MAALTSAPLSVALLSVGLLLSVSAEQRNITAEPGQDVTLTCGAPNNNFTIIDVEWSRTDLEPGYVLIYRDGRLLLYEQHPSFKNRVDLQDRQMKDGNVSLILKNVTTDDGGTYECRVVQRGTNQEKRSFDPISIIKLEVVPPEQSIITAEPGQNVTLTCGAPNNNIPIIAVEWSRAGLEPEYVLLFRDDQIYLEGQDPSFKNRVDLQDRQMKDGDVSLILKNVTTDDGGIYECRVFQRGTNRRKRSNLASDPISIIKLEVVPPGKEEGRREGGGEKAGGEKDGGEKEGGEKDGSVGLIVGLIVGLSVLSLGGFLIYKRKPACLNPYQPPAKPQLI